MELSAYDPLESSDFITGDPLLLFTGDEVFSLNPLFCGEDMLLDDGECTIPRDFFIPNIEENAALMLFLVFRASCPEIILMLRIFLI